MVLFDSPTLRTVALGAAVLGGVSGALGSFAVLRKQSLLGDAVSHASLPGVVMAYLLTGGKEMLSLAIGAALVGWLAMLVVQVITRVGRLPFDSALGGVLAVFFGAGVVLLRYLQNRGDAGQAGLETYLFGQAATMLESDVRTMIGLGAAAASVLAIFWKEFKLLSFDSALAVCQGWPVRALDLLLTGLLVLAVVIGLQSVGVVLMSAMLIAPGVAARQWSHRLGRVVILAAVFGAAEGVAGVWISVALSRPGSTVPTGPAIVLCATAWVLVSLFVATIRARPARGVTA
jgi:manganese/zinc/iron transport system permease protein